jgi:hypothetical protein
MIAGEYSRKVFRTIVVGSIDTGGYHQKTFMILEEISLLESPLSFSAGNGSDFSAMAIFLWEWAWFEKRRP